MTTFLEAKRILANFQGGPPLRFLAAMSGTPDVLNLYLQAAAATRGRTAAVRTLPFNTLGQFLLSAPGEDEIEVFVLFPWDLLPELDWRSGLPATDLDLQTVRARALRTVAQITRRPRAHVVYVQAPIPPLARHPRDDAAFEYQLASELAGIGAATLAPSAFSLGSYLASGNPFAGAQIGAVATAIVSAALAEETREPYKVLVTDLDGVMWAGVIGEDGLEGIQHGAEGIGFRHFLYQGLLKRLKREGTLVAAVSRNDRDLATGPFEAGTMTLQKEDLIAIVASYNAKSAQISQLARELNLSLGSFVFVDDNPIELAEVGTQLPSVRCVRFPDTDEAIPSFLGQLRELFARSEVTEEDAQRTEMYRRRVDGIAPSDVEGADLTEFLRDLRMTLTIYDRTVGNRTRVVQLINKTNQFNLNGIRRTDEEVEAILAANGRLYGAELRDRTGTHGEILAYLIDADGVVRSFVMSCRVFQRRVEHAFLAWLAGQDLAPSTFDFAETPRNEPIRQFLDTEGFIAEANGSRRYDQQAFLTAHGAALDLFTVEAGQALTPAD